MLQEVMNNLNILDIHIELPVVIYNKVDIHAIPRSVYRAHN